MPSSGSGETPATATATSPLSSLICFNEPASAVSVDAFPLLLRNPDDAFGLPGWVHLWRERGGFSDDDEAEWCAGMEQARRHGLVYGVTFLVVAGRRR